jgi:diadenosine tetraphosphatase ApaH/serine/threonine PP2A family protein phosphatase
VGYGADPDGCCAAVRGFAAVCLAGNHDLAAIGALSTESFSPDAATSATWTGEALTPEHREWLGTLRPQGVAQSFLLAHGSPLHPVWEYVLSAEQAEASLDAFEEQVALIGHSHVPLSFARDGGRPVVPQRRTDGDEAQIGAQRWLLNPGSVGQPRDEDPRASWMELHPYDGREAWHRVRYDVGGAQQAIRDAGLPASLADRLGVGR